jgi:hypothetical protein
MMLPNKLWLCCCCDSMMQAVYSILGRRSIYYVSACDTVVMLLLQVGHGEFVTDWPGSFNLSEPHNSSSSGSSSTSSAQAPARSRCSLQQQAALLQQLPAYCRDLAVVVMGEPPVNFVHKSKVAASSSNSWGADGIMWAREGGHQLDPVAAAAGLKENGGVPK